MGDETIIVDNGSGMIKAGFAGEDTPRVRKYFCEPCYMENEEGYSLKKYPIRRGYVKSWNEMENTWQDIIEKELRVKQCDTKVYLTQFGNGSSVDIEKTREIMFEKIGVPAIHIGDQAVLSLYAIGRTTGVVINSGEGVTKCVPVYQGKLFIYLVFVLFVSLSNFCRKFAFKFIFFVLFFFCFVKYKSGHPLCHATSRLDLAGVHLTDYLIKILNEKGHSFKISCERIIVEDIKEKLAFVAQDFDAEMKKAETLSSDGKEKYTLPDGQVITIGNAAFGCGEALFKPILIGKRIDGIDISTHSSVMKCNSAIRRQLYSYIVLSGGTTLIPGIKDRLQRELSKLAPSDYKVNIVAPANRQFTSFIGASIVSSLEIFSNMWYTKADYDESKRKMEPSCRNPVQCRCGPDKVSDLKRNYLSSVHYW